VYRGLQDGIVIESRTGMNEELKNCIESLTAEFKRWLLSPDSMEVPELWDDAIQRCRAVLKEQGVPVGHLSAVLAGWRFQGAYVGKEADEQGGLVRIIEGAQFPLDISWWQPWLELLEERDRLYEGSRKVLESIKSLAETQKVSPLQICRIYGWIDASGRPETWKVEEELAEPGKHTAGHVCEGERARQYKIMKASQEREALKAKLLGRLQRMQARSPETLPELLRQGVSGRQICAILGVSPAELERQCGDLGMEAPAFEYRDIRSQRAAMEPAIKVEAERELDAWTGGAVVAEKDIVEDNAPMDMEKFEIAQEGSGGNRATAVIEQVVDAVASGGGDMTTEGRIKYLRSEGYNYKQIKDALGVTTKDVKAALAD
jgi:hypothetical protein